MNAISHWVQSLRGRGFAKQEIIDFVGDWKAKMEEKIWYGKARSRHSRYPPTSENIERAYDETKNTNYIPQPASEPKISPWAKDKKVINYEGMAPPKNYICNRCGKKGMQPLRRGVFF